MSGLATTLRAIVAALNGLGCQYALVGGLAVSVRTEPRFTRDIDLAVALNSDAEAEAVLSALRPTWITYALVEHDALDRMASARLVSGGDDNGVVVDLLFASSGIEAEVIAAADALEVLDGVVLPVATVGHLIALKILASSPDRPQDPVDIHSLTSVASARDWAEAEAALRLIYERRAHRDRNLIALLESLRQGT